jgi:hypothetical protein
VTAQTRRRLLFSVGLAAVASLVAALALTALAGGAVSSILVDAIPVLGFTSVGVLLGLRAPSNRIGGLFLGFGLVLAVGDACGAYIAPSLNLAGYLAAAIAANVISSLGPPLLPALLLMFPDGHLPSPRWRRWAWVWAVTVCTFMLAVVVWPGAMNNSSRQNPIGIGGNAGGAIAVVGIISFLAICIAAMVAAVSLILRYRQASGDLRQQLKWFGAAAALVAVALVAGLFVHGAASGVAGPAGLTALVVATGIAILRYRLYEIDVIIRRTLIYTTLVGSLAVVYLTGIYLIDRALQAVTGQSGAFAVTLSTLAVAALFQPLRRRIQHGVDHRFYRQKYDATRTLDAFTTRLRDQIDLTALNTEVLDVVNATVQPRHASLWIRPGSPGERRASS